jgi:hypothetical protein
MQIHKILIGIAVALTLAGCQTARQDRQLSGALLGGGAGALIGGLAGRSAGAALAAGTIIADVTRPGWCYYYKHHRKHWVRCR